jgi:hypothetical protein
MSGPDASKLAQRTLIAAVATLGGLALLGAAVWMRRPTAVPIEVSQQITYIITPTRADGWVDYPEAVDWMRRAGLDGGGANAATPLLRALGRDVLPAGIDRGAVLKRLGLDDTGVESSSLQPLRDFVPSGGVAGTEPPPATMEWLRARCRAGGGTPISYAAIRAWLVQSEAFLADLRTASQAASLYIPVARDARGEASFDRVNVARFGDAADALACRAAVSLLQGDGGASWGDVDAIWRLGQLVARSAAPREYATAAAFWKTALGATVDLAASPATGLELRAAMQIGLGTKLGFPPATETLMFHRLAVLDAAGTPLVGKPKFGAPSSGPVARPGTAAKLEAINQQLDAIDVAMQGPDPKQRIARVEQAATAAGQLGAIGRSLLGTEIEGVSAQRLAAIAVGLATLQRAKGSLPATLAEIGSLSGNRGTDPGSGGAFAYAPSGQQFRLHGVGADGRDDGGDSAKDVVVIAREPPSPPAP